jgi:hypothetical protein
MAADGDRGGVSIPADDPFALGEARAELQVFAERMNEQVSAQHAR